MILPQMSVIAFLRGSMDDTVELSFVLQCIEFPSTAILLYGVRGSTAANFSDNINSHSHYHYHHAPIDCTNLRGMYTFLYTGVKT